MQAATCGLYFQWCLFVGLQFPGIHAYRDLSVSVVSGTCWFKEVLLGGRQPLQALWSTVSECLSCVACWLLAFLISGGPLLNALATAAQCFEWKQVSLSGHFYVKIK